MRLQPTRCTRGCKGSNTSPLGGEGQRRGAFPGVNSLVQTQTRMRSATLQSASVCVSAHGLCSCMCLHLYTRTWVRARVHVGAGRGLGFGGGGGELVSPCHSTLCRTGKARCGNAHTLTRACARARTRTPAHVRTPSTHKHECAHTRIPGSSTQPYL